MIGYRKFGNLPSMHHTVHRTGDQLLYEYCFTRKGFDAPYSILYLHHPPTGEFSTRAFLDAEWPTVEKRKAPVLQRRHFRSDQFDGCNNLISGRVLLAFNDHLTYGLCRPKTSTPTFFSNNDADELFFLMEGEVQLQSLFGSIKLVPGDYLIIPRSCPYRFNFEKSPRLMFVEALHGIGIPPQFLNESGQFKMDAPYSERSFKTPCWDDALFENEEQRVIVRKRQGIFTETFYSKNYFKLEGWDGCVYPVALSLDRIQPKTGRVHLPPSSHLTFSGPGFAVMSFLPRVLDFDENAIPCPFYHSSVDCDELLLYVSGKFTSRKGIDRGSISFHPAGIPHGPHPGTYEASIGQKRTDEQAVMVDTFDPLLLTTAGTVLEDPDYPDSWKESTQ
ncbi:MAG: homogentisate 1,2-dioxygenase [Candidatus Nitronauta litoralis]|uniref:Homogentisate 1,2-dioxygenase n=1 Tax=Candidatus Nitronauta litoralis TaxID=2705533 RepID=A0A7T0BVA2_9BACT|nr:MAG: homogentisate 1,2-dioxygenase [Candidatus Nitronauta litoralis]